MQITKVLELGHKENEDIYKEIFLIGCQYTDITFQDDILRNKIYSILFELTKKLVKVVNEIYRFEDDKKSLLRELSKESKRGIGSIGTNNLSNDIENFLTQSTGTLDLYATKFLKNTINYKHNDWEYNQLLKTIESFPTNDVMIKNEILRLLKEDQELWLKDMIYDRNLHHESNFKLSSLSILDGKPFMYLERRNKKQSTDISGYLETNWLNLYGMIKDLTWLTFCMLNPAIKHLRLDKEYFT